jgi:hypothetical protein
MDALRGLGTDVLNGNEEQAVFEEEVDDDVRAGFHRSSFILLVGLFSGPICSCLVWIGPN